jgi:photosystem II stability/assembly factor-like uncharacterized protein
MIQFLKNVHIHRVGVCLWCVVMLLAPRLRAQQVSSDLLHGLSWRLIGSFRGGRVSAVSGIAGDSKTYYIGTPGGGVWKTINGGNTWFPIFDQTHVGSIAEVVVAPSNPNIVYVATGELLRQTNSEGIWKSTDAGATWAYIGLKESRTNPSMLVDPHDANIVYVAALGDFVPGESRGIFKTTDGGKSWRKAFYKDDKTSPTELDFDPSDSRTIFAVIRPIPPMRGEKPVEGIDSTILKSTDAGETWTPLEEKGLPTERRERIGIAVAPATSGKRVFALMKQGLFRSDDGGANWQQITKDPRILGSEYFGRVYSDPKNPEVVYVMQTSTYRSIDGGHTFTGWKGTPSGEDDHVLWIAPEDPTRILMGTDQGGVITLDDGKTWNTWFNQPTGQFYRVAMDNGFPYHLYAAQQDSGSVVIANRSDYGLISYREWFSSGSFESSFIAPDPLQPENLYAMGWYGNIIHLDHATGQIQTLFVAPQNYRASWETPIRFSPRDLHTLFYASQFLLKSPDNGATWKVISPDLTTKAPDPNSPAPKASASGHIPSKDDVENSAAFGDTDDDSDGEGQEAANKGFIQAIAPSPLDDNLIWIGTSTGMIQISHDGATWTDVSPAGLPEHSTINMIEPSAYDENTAFAAVFARRDMHPYFFRTRDAGKTWEKINTGLPDDQIARVVREDPLRKGMLFAGTETGVYLSYDSGDHWQAFQLNLPTTSVRDLVIHGNDLVAATYGRALWILDDISPLRQFGPDLAKTNVQFFVPQAAVRTHWDNHPDTPVQPNEPTAKNPPDGAMLYYFFKTPPKGEITLDILSEKGALIRHYSSVPLTESLAPPNVPEFWFYPPEALPTTAGLNRFVWNLQYPHPTALPYGFFGEPLEYTEYTLPDHAVPGETPRFQPPGPTVAPGKFDLVLTVEGKAYRQKLQVMADPRVHSTAADFATQFDLSKAIYDLMNATASSFQAVSPLEKQLQDRKKSVPANAPKETVAALDTAVKQAGEIEDGDEDAPGFGTLNRNLGRFLEMVQAGDIAPSESFREAYKDSCSAYSKNVAALKKLRDETVPALNKLLAAQSASAIDAKSITATASVCAP